MKKTLLLLLFMAGLLANAQITLEHDYSQSPITRIKLEVSGEKYYYADAAQRKIHLFNQDHTPWKTIDLPVPLSITQLFIDSISEHIINPDDNMEVVFSFYYSGTHAGMVVSENGTILLSVPNVKSLYLDRQPGLDPKIIGVDTSEQGPVIYTSAVYNVPGMNMEQFYSNGEIHRIVLENSGEKYYIFDRPAQAVKLYNANHSSWKDIAVPKPINAIYSDISFISESQVNPDNFIEVAYGYYNFDTETQQAIVVNDFGDLLLTAEGANRFSIGYENGNPATLIGYSGYETPGNTYIYALPSLVLAHTFAGEEVQPADLDVSGKKYYTQHPSGNIVKLYNADFTLWKSIVMSPPGGLSLTGSGITHISENKVNGDNLIELAYTYENLDVWESHVINENGVELLNVNNASYIFLSDIPGLDYKFITNMMQPATSGQVYALDALGIAGVDQDKLLAYPVPAKDFINLKAGVAIKEVVVYDSSGKQVGHVKGSDITGIDVAALPAGMYLLCITDEGNDKQVKRIMTSH